MLITKKIKLGFDSTKFGNQLELPEPNQTIVIISQHYIWPLVKKAWLETKQPLYICTFSLSNEISLEIKKLIEQGNKLGALEIDKSFENSDRKLALQPTKFIENHAKVYICGSYSVMTSANLNKGSRRELTQVTNNLEFAQTLKMLTFG
jgi:hypothetical protein